jgi:hypothetical protein
MEYAKKTNRIPDDLEGKDLISGVVSYLCQFVVFVITQNPSLLFVEP